MNDCMVSIVVPAYNAEEYIVMNVESLLNQTYKNFELIYVNDGSSDDTLSILNGYKKSDDRIKILTQANQGAGAARNYGLDNATGKYVIILDADDYFDENLLSVLVREAEEKETDILIYGGYKIDHITGEKTVLGGAIKKRYMPEKEIFSADDIPDDIFQITGYWAWNKLYRRGFIEENNIRFQNIPLIDDAFFNVLALALAKRISACDEKLIYYRVNNTQSQSANVSIHARQFYKAHKYMIEAFSERNIYNKFSRSIDKGILEHFAYSLIKCEDYETYRNTYNEIKDYMEKLGVYERLGENICNYEYGDIFIKVKELSVEEFLFNRYQNARYRGLSFSFPADIVKKNDKVILYGTGAIGKSFFIQNAIKEYCIINEWLSCDSLQKDKENIYNEKVLECKSYDYILIAVEDYREAERIEKCLIQVGIVKSKIKWLNPQKTL